MITGVNNSGGSPSYNVFELALKGPCHEIFCFPQAPEYPIRTVSNFFENSRRYSQIKVHHRPPVSTTPVANLPPVSTAPVANFATSFASVVDTGGKFATVSTIPAANLPPVSMTPVAICHRFQNTGGK